MSLGKNGFRPKVPGDGKKNRLQWCWCKRFVVGLMMFIKLSPTSVYIIRHQPRFSALKPPQTTWLGRKLSVDPFLLARSLSVMWCFFKCFGICGHTCVINVIILKTSCPSSAIDYWILTGFKPSCGWLDRGLVSEDTVTQFRTHILIWYYYIINIWKFKIRRRLMNNNRLLWKIHRLV